MKVAERAATNTLLCGSAGGASVMLINALHRNPADVDVPLNGVLIGLVAITAGCMVVESYGAIVIGFISGAVYFYLSKVLLWLKIDDPVDASVVHLGGGCVGVLAVGFFAVPRFVVESTVIKRFTRGAPLNIDDTQFDYGVFYRGKGKLLVAQIVGMICIILWTSIIIAPMFTIFNYFKIFRLAKSEEQSQLDLSLHGGDVYKTNAIGQRYNYAAARNDKKRDSFSNNSNKNYGTNSPIDVYIAKDIDPERDFQSSKKEALAEFRGHLSDVDYGYQHNGKKY